METIARTGRTGWKDNEIHTLRDAITTAGSQGEPLRGVFERIGTSLGRKPNSVRNFYYAFMKRDDAEGLPHAAPFDTFTPDEVRWLVKEVLRARAQGVSVRACVFRLAEGDRKQMLRYQNKYRSILKTRPRMVKELLTEMEADGEPTYNPLESPMGRIQPLHAGIASSIRESGDPALLGLLKGLDTLLSRAGCVEPSPLEVACQPMVQGVKEFLGIPQEQRDRELDGFCRMLAERVGAVENAMSV